MVPLLGGSLQKRGCLLCESLSSWELIGQALPHGSQEQAAEALVEAEVALADYKIMLHAPDRPSFEAPYR